MSTIPVNAPVITDAAKRYVAEAMETGWISSAGPCIGKFEEKFAEYTEVKHAIFVTSGTSALHLALLALGVGPGDEVIVPDFTMIASAFAVMYTGAQPVFVDVEPDTYNIDPALIEKKISKRTKAIMPVHIYGHSCDMDAISAIAEKYGLFIVEDAAEVHGARYKGRRCGSMGHVNAFSFYGNKIITTGEGGMVCTNDDALAQKIRELKDLAHDPRKRFRHTALGFNYRPTNLQAAVGLGQLESIEAFLERKRSMAKLYQEGLGDIPGLRLPVTKDYAENVYWMYAVLVEDALGMTRDELCKRLREQGVDTREFFFPCHSQPAVTELYPEQGEFPVTDFIAERGFYLPSGLALTDDDIRQVCEKVRTVCQL